MRHGIGCNIIDVINQFFLAYRGLAPELIVFVLPQTKSNKADDFIYILKKKQDVRYRMMTISIILNQYHNNFCHPSPFSSSSSRPPFSSQSEAFFCYQAQGFQKPAQQTWRLSDGLVNNNSNGLRCQAAPPFRQTFIPQRQQYPTNNQRFQ